MSADHQQRGRGEAYPAARGVAFDDAERRDLLDERDHLRRLDPREHPDVHRRVSEVTTRYREAVPFVPVARDPFSGEVFAHSLDPFGLDGLWWDCEGGGRPPAQFPATYLGLRGAMRLTEPVEDTSFLVKPGPEVPVVLPRLLGHDGVLAVVMQVPVGAHAGYAITYFADPQPDNESPPDDWGLNFSQRVSATREPVWDKAHDDHAGDADLERWIEDGRLLWIAPDDSSFTLHRSTAGCPYLGLEGSRIPARVQSGRVWRS